MNPPPVLRFLLPVLLALALPLRATMSEDDVRRFHRLRTAPITLYPEADLAQSQYPAFVNERARPGDAIVMSHIDAFKTSFRLSQLGVRNCDVWVYVVDGVDFSQNGRSHIEGAKGILFVPSGEHERHDTLFSVNSRLAEDAAAIGCPLITGLEPHGARSLANVADLARGAAIFTIYDNLKLKGGAKSYRAYVERLVREAKKANPAVKIEVSICTGRDPAATKALAGVLWECSDLIDRIGIYCDESPESRASLETLYRVLRDSG